MASYYTVILHHADDTDNSDNADNGNQGTTHDDQRPTARHPTWPPQPQLPITALLLPPLSHAHLSACVLLQSLKPMHAIQFVKIVYHRHNHAIVLCLFFLHFFCEYNNKYENKLSCLIHVMYVSRQKLYYL